VLGIKVLLRAVNPYPPLTPSILTHLSTISLFQPLGLLVTKGQDLLVRPSDKGAKHVFDTLRTLPRAAWTCSQVAFAHLFLSIAAECNGNSA